MANSGETRGHILVVDDNKINQMMLSRALTSQGYQVITANDGGQALDILNSKQSETIDVVLLDIIMPDLDGYQVLEQIKRKEDLRHIPVIMISALDEMDSVIRCIEMGATDFLHKPYNPALLQARLNASLAEKRLRDLEREYLEQVGHVVKAAESVESATYDPQSLDDVAEREDALGQLARVFQRMADEVHLREQRLKLQLEQLRLDVEDMKKSQSEPLSVYIPMDRRQAMVHGISLPESSEGVALFADISGFTPFGEALANELGHQRGAEELTRILNRVYGALVAEVHRYHGSVVNFSGDAITCWLEVKNDLQGVACALAMQEAMKRFARISTPTGSSFSLAVKVIVAAGSGKRFLVGNPQIQNIEILAGKTLDCLVAGEQLAKPGEVLVEDGITQDHHDVIKTGEKRTHAETGQSFSIVSALSIEVPSEQWIELRKDVLSEEQCRPWILPAVYEQAISGAKAYLSELRQATALFLSFTGIDFENDERAIEKLDGYIRWVQSVIDQHEGSMLQLTIGDKGNYLYATFGAPIAHNDDALRAVYAAFALQDVPQDFNWIKDIKIGVTQGQMRTGAYGSPTRRTYGAQGDIVNLAARLMQAAEEGILCDASVYQATHARLVYKTLPAIIVKGKTEPVEVYRPTGEKKRLSRKRASLIGRFSERIFFAEKLRELTHGTNSLILLEGEAGIGKTRLVEMIQGLAEGLNLETLVGNKEIEVENHSYQAWKDIFWQLLSLDPEESEAERYSRLQEALKNSHHELSLFSQLDFMSQFSQFEYGSNDPPFELDLEALLDLLAAKTQDTPKVIIFENAQDLDEASWELIQEANKTVSNLMILVVTRPVGERMPESYEQLLKGTNFSALKLKGLSMEESYLLAGEHLNVGSLPKKLVQILEKTGGNPQFIEEMIYILRDDGHIVVQNGVCEILPHVDLDSITFPTTAQGLIMSRLDRLSPSEQLTLKVASVAGQNFSLGSIQQIYPLESEKPYLLEHLESLSKLDLINQASSDSNYRFRDEATYDAVYSSMLFSQRRQLHRQMAEWIETSESDDLAPHFPVLANHWLKADDTAKAIDYLEKAGQEALLRGDYEEAESFFKQCLELDSTAAVLSAEYFKKRMAEKELIEKEETG